MATEFRLTIDWLLPPSQRAGNGVEGAVAGQQPVGPWMDVCDWYHLYHHMLRARPLAGLGLLYGEQRRVRDGPSLPAVRHAAFLAAAAAGTLDAHCAGVAADRAALHAGTERRAAEFVAGFDFAAYGLARALDGVSAVPAPPAGGEGAVTPPAAR